MSSKASEQLVRGPRADGRTRRQESVWPGPGHPLPSGMCGGASQTQHRQTTKKAIQDWCESIWLIRKASILLLQHADPHIPALDMGDVYFLNRSKGRFQDIPKDHAESWKTSFYPLQIMSSTYNATGCNVEDSAYMGWAFICVTWASLKMFLCTFWRGLSPVFSRLHVWKIDAW